jgi:hypothetical protein
MEQEFHAILNTQYPPNNERKWIMRNAQLLASVALVAVGGAVLCTVYVQLAPLAAALPRALGVLLAGG